MQLTLLVPGLLLPAAIRSDTLFDLNAPSLSLLLGRGVATRGSGDWLHWLPEAFGLQPPLPVAALRKVGTGRTANGHWLCLDPVHLSVTREGISLADPATLAISDNEAAQLIEALAPLFAGWGTLSASAPGHWELELQHSLDLETRALPDGIGVRVDPQLPGGPDGRAWRRLIAEAQTLMHDHPVNRCRDSQNLPTINSLWPWGAGTLPAKPDTLFKDVWSSDPALAGLCAHAELSCQPHPPRFQPPRGNTLAIDERLLAPARALDALIWRDALLALERDWIAPALAALRGGDCTQFRLVGTGSGLPALVLTLERNRLWHVWRRPQRLTELG